MTVPRYGEGRKAGYIRLIRGVKSLSENASTVGPLGAASVRIAVRMGIAGNIGTAGHIASDVGIG